MPDKPSNLGQFWQELKRRKVIHVITLYASASFVIIELINNLAEPFNLPQNLLTIVVIVLAVGFPLAIILSWLYDVTSEGVEKTKPIEEVKEGEKTVVPNAWKIATYVSFVVIVGLAVLNIVGGTTKLHAGDIQSLVVLPFENYTGDEQLENMVSGMHAMLVGDMGRISGVRVLGKTTSNVYKDVDISATEIASELNVDAIVEASVMCLGDSVCMQFRLVRTTGEEEQIWIADYKVDKSQILNLYNKITKQIAEEIMIELTPEEERLLAKSRTVDREAYDAYLKGHQYLDDISLESLNKAREYLNIAIEKDPDWVPLYSSLATVWMALAQNSLESPSVAYSKVYEYLNKALERDPDHADTHYLMAMTAWLNEWNWAKAEREFLKAMAGNPNDALSRVWYAHLLMCLHRSDEAQTQAQLASDLDPLNPFIQTMFSMVLLDADDCETAMAPVEKVLAIEPENFIANMVLGVVAFHCGDYNKVIETEKYLLKGYSRGQFEEDAYKEIERIFDEQGFSAAYEEVLHQWEVLADKGFVGPIDMAVFYIRGNQQDKAMDLIEKGFELRDPNMPYLATKSYTLDSLYDNPRFIAILEKMNLPMPKD